MTFLVFVHSVVFNSYNLFFTIKIFFKVISLILRRNCRLQQVIEGKIKGGIEVEGRRRRRRRKLLDDLKERRG
jgi:hypothetical protein